MTAMSLQIPAAPVGRTVHFVNATGDCRAAIVTEIKPDGARGLHVFHPRELGDRANIPFNGEGAPMSWHTFEGSTEPGCRVADDS